MPVISRTVSGMDASLSALSSNLQTISGQMDTMNNNMASVNGNMQIMNKQMLLEIGDKYAQYIVGYMYLNGLGTERDADAALEGGLGVKLQLDDVPQREENMSAYEMMLSESQERMLMVLRPEKEAEARAVFEKWDLDFAIVGETIAEDRFLILHGNEVKADLPLSKLSSTAPEYDRPWVETPAVEISSSMRPRCPRHTPRCDGMATTTISGTSSVSRIRYCHASPTQSSPLTVAVTQTVKSSMRPRKLS